MTTNQDFLNDHAKRAAANWEPSERQKDAMFFRRNGYYPASEAASADERTVAEGSSGESDPNADRVAAACTTEPTGEAFAPKSIDDYWDRLPPAGGYGHPAVLSVTAEIGRREGERLHAAQLAAVTATIEASGESPTDDKPTITFAKPCAVCPSPDSPLCEPCPMGPMVAAAEDVGPIDDPGYVAKSLQNFLDATEGIDETAAARAAVESWLPFLMTPNSAGECAVHPCALLDDLRSAVHDELHDQSDMTDLDWLDADDDTDEWDDESSDDDWDEVGDVRYTTTEAAAALEPTATADRIKAASRALLAHLDRIGMTREEDELMDELRAALDAGK